jgi:hypothetical protein
MVADVVRRNADESLPCFRFYEEIGGCCFRVNCVVCQDDGLARTSRKALYPHTEKQVVSPPLHSPTQAPQFLLLLVWFRFRRRARLWPGRRLHSKFSSTPMRLAAASVAPICGSISIRGRHDDDAFPRLQTFAGKRLPSSSWREKSPFLEGYRDPLTGWGPLFRRPRCPGAHMRLPTSLLPLFLMKAFDIGDGDFQAACLNSGERCVERGFYCLRVKHESDLGECQRHHTPESIRTPPYLPLSARVCTMGFYKAYEMTQVQTAVRWQRRWRKAVSIFRQSKKKRIFTIHSNA